MAASTEKRTVSRRRGLGVGLVFFLLLALTVISLLYFQVPQRYVIKKLAARLLGADIAIEDLRTWGTPGAGRLVLRGSEHLPPLAVFDDVSVEYALWPEDGRYLRNVAIGSVALNFQGAEGVYNYDFLREALAREGGGGDSAAFLPKAVALRQISVDVTRPDWQFSAGPVAFNATLESRDAMRVSLEGDAVNAAWQVYTLNSSGAVEQGSVSIAGAVTAQGYDVFADLALGELAAGTATLALARTTGGGNELSGNIEELVLGSLWGELLSDLAGTAVHFDEFRVSNTAVAGAWTRASVERLSSEFLIRAEGLLLGPADAPWYEGALEAEGHGEGTAGRLDLEAELRLDEGQNCQVVVAGDSTNASATLTFAPWKRGALAALLPGDIARYLDFVPGMESVSGRADLTWARPQYSLVADLAPMLEGGRAAEVDVSAEGAWLGGVYPLSLAVNGRVEDTALESTWTIADTAVDGKITFNKTALRPWLAGWLATDAVDEITLPLSGTLEVARAGDEPVQLRADVSASQFKSGSLSLDALALKGSGEVQPEAKQLAGDSLLLASGEANVLDLGQWTLRWSPFEISGGSSGEIDLAWVGGLFGQPSLFGATEFSGPLRLDGGQFTGEIETTFTDLGYGEWSLPYGQTLTLEGGFAYAFGPRTLASEALALHLSPGSDATVQALQLDLPLAERALHASIGTLELDTDLHPVVARGYLQEAEGHASVKGSAIAYTDGALEGDFTASVDAQAMTLPKALASLEAVTLDSSFRYDRGMAGSGALKVGALKIAGTELNDLSSDVKADYRSLIFEGIRSELYGGEVEATAVLGLLQEHLPFNLLATVREVDLTRFTEEFKPPDIRLTGIVSGEGGVDLDLEGLRNFRVQLESTEDFSINRDAVQKLLMSHYMAEMSGGKELEKIVLNVVGEKEQRYFERAFADLELSEETGRITGPLVLESDLLDLTVDLKADPGALLEALRVRQRQH